jgi:sugar lactone lactonase YvrE
LAWPYQWYFRDFKRLENRNADFFHNATPESFIVDPVQPGAERALAPVVLISKGTLNETTRAALDANYVKRYDSKLNWWFPEGYKCDPESPGYKRFYYSTAMVADAFKDCPNIDVSKIHNIFAPLLWPFDSSHWGNTWKYLLYRELPEPLRLDGREMEVWVRRDLAPVGGTNGSVTGSSTLKLVAQQSFGSQGQADGQFNGASAAAVDSQGNLYIADTLNHRIAVLSSDGKPIRTIGSFGSGDGQFFEPRGVAVDSAGNLYVADTWNARVVKFDSSGKFLKSWGEGKEDFGGGRRASPTDGSAAGNQAQPLGFFGPRGIAVDTQGNVYLADTGNKRIVVTDSEGNYRYQWGTFGSAAGQFSEPIGVAVDNNNVYVADTWNGRVQVFARDETGQAKAEPTNTWRITGWLPQTYDDPFIAVNNGQVAVSIPGANAMLLTDATGKDLLRWGGAGNDIASLKLPSGLAFAPDGTLFVVDRGNSRIMHFKLPLVEANP